MIRLVINGISGKMGNYLYHSLKGNETIEVVAGISRQPDLNLVLPIYRSLEECLVKESLDMVVDFSTYPQCLEVVKQAIMSGKHVVSGTTGYKTYDGKHMAYLAEKHGVGIIISPNFSLSEEFIAFISTCAKRYPYAYITESHDVHKKDQPSGTALFLAKLLDVKQENIHSIRLPNVLAKHTILFSDDSEKVTVTHRTNSRVAFVKGIIDAIHQVASEQCIKLMI